VDAQQITKNTETTGQHYSRDNPYVTGATPSRLTPQIISLKLTAVETTRFQTLCRHVVIAIAGAGTNTRTQETDNESTIEPKQPEPSSNAKRFFAQTLPRPRAHRSFSPRTAQTSLNQR
jgi:hypothetical protein